MNSFNNEANPSASNPIIVQVDPSNFRATVQKLTGAGPPNDPSPQKPRERRRGSKKLELELAAAETTGRSRTVGGLEGFGSKGLMASPVSTLEFLARRSPTTPATPYLDEERAMAEKGFFMHPTQLHGAEPPELLPLFPLHSP